MFNEFSFVFTNQVIAAEGEQKASHSLKEAAMVIAESPSALQVDIIATFLLYIEKLGKTYVKPFKYLFLVTLNIIILNSFFMIIFLRN